MFDRRKEDRCPFIKLPPSKDCYCVKVDSLSTSAAIDYCVNDYQSCGIFISYRKNNSTVMQDETSATNNSSGRRERKSMPPLRARTEVGRISYYNGKGWM